MKLSFTAEYAGLLLLLNGLLVLMFLYGRKKKRERVMQFGNYETLKKVAGGNFLRSDDLILITRILAVTALLIGLSSPVLVQEVMGSDSDFVLVLDSSASMFTSDIEPNRFQAAKDVSKDFVSQLGNSSQVGLISYAGSVNEEQELTNEHSALRNSISQTSIGGRGGTATGDAVAAGVTMLTGNEKPGTVILITDGRNTVGQSLNESANYAQRQNTTVNAIGIGGSSNNTQDDFGIIQGNNASRMEFPNLNRDGLNNLSNSTGGEAVFVSNRQGLQDAFIELEEKKSRNDISTWFFLLAGGLLVIEAVFRTTDLQVIP
ncbi:vWA domain-containing protein [Candidatus Nanohalobium constans]|uniref:von Willebrand factor type A / Ca-activated chloride channel-like protein n=1 Tax=Candidatus Nanohalobium constans TaxID=2565781 RepID=A0A5Q0UFH7_9ARCH|nr:VWA domain-containing protein [Candidatus Nanohalobium constans]QGA80121.1 von Willebrand factor type A / Ca-activated chloride channel-like protein [Candidatus Nanohalobium constans]